jgi:hypothetical protein
MLQFSSFRFWPFCSLVIFKFVACLWHELIIDQLATFSYLVDRRRQWNRAVHIQYDGVEVYCIFLLVATWSIEEELVLYFLLAVHIRWESDASLNVHVHSCWICAFVLPVWTCTIWTCCLYCEFSLVWATARVLFQL